jgi:hypothetical protein
MRSRAPRSQTIRIVLLEVISSLHYGKNHRSRPGLSDNQVRLTETTPSSALRHLGLQLLEAGLSYHAHALFCQLPRVHVAGLACRCVSGRIAASQHRSIAASQHRQPRGTCQTDPIEQDGCSDEDVGLPLRTTSSLSPRWVLSDGAAPRVEYSAYGTGLSHDYARQFFPRRTHHKLSLREGK